MAAERQMPGPFEVIEKTVYLSAQGVKGRQGSWGADVIFFSSVDTGCLFEASFISQTPGKLVKLTAHSVFTRCTEPGLILINRGPTNLAMPGKRQGLPGTFAQRLCLNQSHSPSEKPGNRLMPRADLSR